MATLHVRNVPEPIYELLRECAESEGRSIGAQAIFFIQQGVIPRASRRALPRRRRSGGFHLFTSGARQAVVRAQEEARAAGASHVEPSHVVLALAAIDPGAAQALRDLSVDPGEVRAGLVHGPGSPAQIPFAAATKRVLEGALRESLALRHDHIGSEHLLLALASDPLFEPAGGEGAVRAAVTLATMRSGAGPLPHDDRSYLAVDLSGAAEAWTAKLNELADDGWELMQIVDSRAVLRRDV